MASSIVAYYKCFGSSKCNSHHAVQLVPLQVAIDATQALLCGTSLIAMTLTIYLTMRSKATLHTINPGPILLMGFLGMKLSNITFGV